MEADKLSTFDDNSSSEKALQNKIGFPDSDSLAYYD